jgi:uncharacterized protein (DUF1697 family)
MKSSYLALLKGINVGGKNKLPMQDLKDIFIRAGCTEVRTFIQSGNVIFNSSPDLVHQIAGRVSTAIQERFGYEVPVLLRSAGQLAGVVGNNPYVKEGADTDSLHVIFLQAKPDPDRLARIDANWSAPDSFVLQGQEIYLRLPDGAARTKLTVNYFDSRLQTVCTGRNWNTVSKLVELMKTEQTI